VRCFEDEVALDAVAVVVCATATTSTVGVCVCVCGAGNRTVAGAITIVGVLMVSDSADRVAVRIHSGASSARAAIVIAGARRRMRFIAGWGWNAAGGVYS
jgi:hypothetical protein